MLHIFFWQFSNFLIPRIISKTCSVRPGKRYQATLHLGLSSSTGALSSGSDHGLTLELGVYVAKIQPGSVAAKEGVIAIGDRIVSVSTFEAILNYFLFFLLPSNTKWIVLFTEAIRREFLMRFFSWGGYKKGPQFESKRISTKTSEGEMIAYFLQFYSI